ncbi:imidazole glycerol phosphate synthase subunit HisF [Candidatus Babeliales bacterium]|nr:imidazole glycerol phosphate synthase subunit HisF [Candidatus Babeliales bacterium]
MLKIRLIPVLLLKKGRMVKTIKFNNLREVGNPSTTVRVYDAQGADEIVFLDIDASIEGRKSFYEIIEKAADETFIPFTAGGGVRGLDDIKSLLSIGADKVSINTAALENPEFIRNAAEIFGKQCIVVSIDVRTIGGRYYVVTGCGTKVSGLDPAEWAAKAEALGAGEILLSSIDRDGTMQGYDLELIKMVSDVISIPVIANSGVGNLQDFKDCLMKGGTNAIAAASIFHFTDQSIIKIKAFLKTAGFDVRQT